ncbi:MAG: HlyC/CorC family transporter [Deltaproteobacteria bacterium]|nr:HlyC/CorC family transporter [Deltaproteobacteria bacterium]
MDYAIAYKFGLLALLLAFSGFFSGSEASFFSLTALHLHKMKEARYPFAKAVQGLLLFPRRLLITILVGNESVNVAITALTTSVFIYFLGTEGKWGAIAATTIAVVIFGEAIPKTFAVTHPMNFSNAASLPLILFSRLFYPLTRLLEKIADLFIDASGRKRPEAGAVLTEDDFKTLVDAGHQEGALEKSQKELIHRVFDLADITVEEVMTPRVDMFCLPLSMNVREMEHRIMEARHSRVPVYGSDRDDIIGILHAKHLLAELAAGRKKFNIKGLLKKPYYVPLEKEAHGMLGEFKLRHLQMAIAVDEYGGVAGLVTLTDILESLVGELRDGRFKQEDVTLIGKDLYRVSGMMDLEAFNEYFGITTVSPEEFDTVGGFILHLFGELPAKGASVAFDGYVFTAETVKKARIVTIQVARKEEDGNV